MKISLFNNNFNNNNNLSFSANGKPLRLAYILEKRSYLLPERILESAKLQKDPNKSLLEIHKEIYAPLLECKTLDEAKKLFQEFDGILDIYPFERNSVNKKLLDAYMKDSKETFALKMLKEFWANLKTKTEIINELGLRNTTALEWALEKINFLTFANNYRSLIKASTVEGNELKAAKTRAWNAAHPDLMRAHNKKAAQAWKRPELRDEQSRRIKEYDKKHPERRQKISDFDKKTWDLCPEIKLAFSVFKEEQTPFLRNALNKKTNKKPLTDTEKRAIKGFYKRFWDSHPECKAMLKEAKRIIREELV